MDPDEKSFASNRKSGQCKSLQALTSKTVYEKISDKLKAKTKDKELIHKLKSNSHKSLKRSKFDTPEKNPSPKAYGEINRSPISAASLLMELNTPVPFPSNLSLVPKNQIYNLIKKGQPTSNHINPILLTPILVGRKKIKEGGKTPLVARSSSPIDGKIIPESTKGNPFQINLLKFATAKQVSEKPKTQSTKSEKTQTNKAAEEQKILKLKEIPPAIIIPIHIDPKSVSKIEEILENQDIPEDGIKIISPETTPEESKMFYYNKLAQPSFGGEIFIQVPEEEEPAFLSERHSYECESNQSLKFDLDRPGAAISKQDSNEFVESHHSSFAHETEKNDIETQTEERPLPDMLKCLNDSEIKLGIKFISQIAQFMKSFK